MGYWTTNTEGHSFAEGTNPDGSDMIWGDAPADVMDVALKRIIRDFRKDLGRAPTLEELKAGLLFSAAEELNRDQKRREDSGLYTFAVITQWSWTDFDGTLTSCEDELYFDAVDEDDAKRQWQAEMVRHDEALPDSDMRGTFVSVKQIEPTRRKLELVSAEGDSND